MRVLTIFANTIAALALAACVVDNNERGLQLAATQPPQLIPKQTWVDPTPRHMVRADRDDLPVWMTSTEAMAELFEDMGSSHFVPVQTYRLITYDVQNYSEEDVKDLVRQAVRSGWGFDFGGAELGHQVDQIWIARTNRPGDTIQIPLGEVKRSRKCRDNLVLDRVECTTRERPLFGDIPGSQYFILATAYPPNLKRIRTLRSQYMEDPAGFAIKYVKILEQYWELLWAETVPTPISGAGPEISQAICTQNAILGMDSFPRRKGLPSSISSRLSSDRADMMFGGLSFDGEDRPSFAQIDSSTPGARDVMRQLREANIAPGGPYRPSCRGGVPNWPVLLRAIDAVEG